MTQEQINDALEVLAKTIIDLSKKKELRDYFDKSNKESVTLLEDALRQARKEKKRSNPWIPKS